MNNTPAAKISARGDGSMSGQNDGPVKLPPAGEHLLLAHETTGVHSAGDDAHRFLGVVAAMSETVTGGRKQLQFAKPAVHLLRSLMAQQPIRTGHEQQA